MKLYSIETTKGMCIREAGNEQRAWNKVQREIGTLEEILDLREANEEDIMWVRGMGGYIPE